MKRVEWSCKHRSGEGGGVLGGGRGFGLAAEDEAAAFAAGVGGVVDLLPEADEVVDRGDDGDDGHPVDGGDGDEMNSNDVAASPVGKPDPVVPAVGQDGGDDGDDLDEGLELAGLAGLDGETFGGGDGVQDGDGELAPDDEDGDPWLHDAGAVAHEDDVAGGDEEFVGERVEQHAHGGDLVAAGGVEAVEAGGDGGGGGADGGGDLPPAARGGRGAAGRRRGRAATGA